MPSGLGEVITVADGLKYLSGLRLQGDTLVGADSLKFEAVHTIRLR